MSQKLADEATIQKVSEDKPFRYNIQNLEHTYGKPYLSKKSNVLAMLINIILSQATSDANSKRTFENLKNQFERLGKCSVGGRIENCRSY